MPARTPDEADLIIAEVFKTGNVEAALALSEPTASIFDSNGSSLATGTAAPRELPRDWIGRTQAYHLEVVKSVTSGDLALVSTR